MARPGQDSPGVLGQDTERLARHGLDWPRDSRTAGRARRGPSSIGKDPQAWSDVDYQARHGAAGMAAQGRAPSVPARQAWHGIAPRGGVRLAWICIAAIGWDCPGAAGMARWACNVAAGMASSGLDALRRHRRYGTDCQGSASIRTAGLACSGKVWPGSAMRGRLGSSWKRFARLASAGMAADATTW